MLKYSLPEEENRLFKEQLFYNFVKILVIEDEPKIAQAIKKGLELKNFAVDAVYDSDQGYSYALDKLFSLADEFKNVG